MRVGSVDGQEREGMVELRAWVRGQEGEGGRSSWWQGRSRNLRTQTPTWMAPVRWWMQREDRLTAMKPFPGPGAQFMGSLHFSNYPALLEPGWESAAASRQGRLQVGWAGAGAEQGYSGGK